MVENTDRHEKIFSEEDKLRYRKPVLQNFGSLKRLTRGASGSVFDLASNKNDNIRG